jgi:hypothetical protein
VLNSSVDPQVTAAPSAAGSPAVERGDWRGNNHSPKPCLHRILVVSIAVVSSAVLVVNIAEPHHDAAPVQSRVETKVLIFVLTQKFCEKFLLAFLKKSL